jgi:hypothetical protein
MLSNTYYQNICRCYIDDCGSTVYVKIEQQNEFKHFVNFKCEKGHDEQLVPLKEFLKNGQEQYQKLWEKIHTKKIKKFENQYQIKDIIWIDENIDDYEKENYCEQIENKYNIKCCRCKTFAEGRSIIKDIQFKRFILIISEKLRTQYIETLNKIKNEISCIPMTIIFSSINNDLINNKKEEKYKKYQKDNFNDFYNLENIVTNFFEVDYFINKILFYKHETFDILYTEKPSDYNNCYSFEYINNNSGLIFPSLYIKIMNKMQVSYKEIEEFNEFLIKNFGETGLVNLVDNLVLVKNIPPIIIAKFWARLYTLENPFYSNLNWHLMKLQNQQYNSYIQLLYSNLKDYTYRNKENIFRGGIISNDEFTEIQNILKYKKMNPDSQKKVLIYSRTFLSFSKSKIIAYN